MDHLERDGFTIALTPNGRVVSVGPALRRRLGLPERGPVALGRVLTRIDGGPISARALAAMALDGCPLPEVRLAPPAGGGAHAVRADVERRGRLRGPRLRLTLAPAAEAMLPADLARAVEGHLPAAVLAPDGTVRSANGALLACLGLDAGDVAGAPHAALLAPGEAETLAYRRHWRALREGRTATASLRHRAAGGGDVWLLASFVPAFDAGGAVMSVAMVAQVVTAEREAARDADAKVDALDASQAVIEFAPDGTILNANANLLRAFGYEAADVIGRHHRMLVPEAERTGQAYEEFWRTLRRGEFASGRFLRVGRDGRRVWIQATYNPILAADGSVAKIVKFASDVTERVEREAILQSESAALRRSNAVVRFDLGGTVVEANGAFARALGFERAEDVVGRHHSSFVDPEEAASEGYRQFWARLRAGEFHAGEFLRRARDGSAVWIQATYNPVLDGRGEVVQIVKFAADITEAKRASARHEGKIAAIGRSHALVEFDRSGQILDANDVFLDALGYRRDEVVGRPRTMLVGKDNGALAADRERWARLDAGEVVSAEVEHCARDGRSVWLRIVYSPVLDPCGAPASVFASAVDITAEIADRARIDLLSMVTNETDNSVVITDPDGRIVYANRGFTELTGFTLDEVRGKRPGSLLQGKRTDPATKARIRDKLARRVPCYEEILNYTRTGQPYWISLAINPVLNPDGSLRSFVSIQSNIDATKRQSLEFTRRLEAISATSAVAEWDAAGRPLLRNRYLEEMGCAPIALDAVLGAGERACVVNGETIRREVQWPRVGMEPMTLDAVFNSVSNDEGEVSKVLMFGIDVTERNAVVREAMATIEASTDRIEGMVGAIQDIANQTRTLSLNATVEASKAGDAGRGFAVVAGEVRGLADRATEAASHIAALLRENRARATSLGRDAREPEEWAAAASPSFPRPARGVDRTAP